MDNQTYNLQNFDEILKSFGINDKPVLLSGGQGTSYLCGNIVIKPEEDEIEASWVAEVFSKMTVSEIRVSKPIKAINGYWIHNGWSAHTFIEGEITKDRWKEKIEIGRKLHKAVAYLEKPRFIGKRFHPWEIADKMVWGESKLKYGSELELVISKLKPLLRLIKYKEQIIHGDLTGNILFHPKLEPAVIDFSPYWRPVEYATAIIIVDSIVWENAPTSLMSELSDTKEMNQLLIRAAMWRIITTEEFIKQYGRGNIEDVCEYHTFIDVLLKRKNL